MASSVCFLLAISVNNSLLCGFSKLKIDNAAVSRTSHVVILHSVFEVKAVILNRRVVAYGWGVRRMKLNY